MTKIQGVIQKFNFRLQSVTKSLGKFLKIKQNWAKPEKFGYLLLRKFDRYYQLLVFGEETG